MPAPYILAKNYQDANKFAQEVLGIGKGYYRIVTSPSSISGRRGTTLYIVPGWEKRSDRFAMRSALKYCRLELIYVDQDSVQEPEPQAQIDDEVTSDESHDFVVEDAVHNEDMISEGGHAPVEEEVQPPAEEPERKTRRRRCRECGELVEPEDLTDHAAKHISSEE